MGWIVLAFIVIGVLMTVFGEVKRQKAKSDAEAAQKKFDEKDELKKFLTSAPTSQSAQKPSASGSLLSDGDAAKGAGETQVSAAFREANKRRYDEIREKNRLRLEEIEREQEGHHAAHCDVAHASDDKYRVERVPVMNSIGGKSTEGCGEHYDLRFVKIDEQISCRRELTDLQKVVVLGEVINQPAFRRRGCSRR